MEKIKNFTSHENKKRLDYLKHTGTHFFSMLNTCTKLKDKTKQKQDKTKKKTRWAKTATYHRRTIFLLKRLTQQYIAAQAKD